MERDICCLYCDFKALDKEQLTTHVRARHTGERPFVCDLCGASFTAKRHLRQHMPKHTDLRPVQCDTCPSRFKMRHDLVVHTSKVHRPIRVLNLRQELHARRQRQDARAESTSGAVQEAEEDDEDTAQIAYSNTSRLLGLLSVL